MFEGEALVGYCVLMRKEAKETELLTASFKFSFMLIKKFSGAFQLSSTVNRSVKPLLILTVWLLILTGCFSEVCHRKSEYWK